MLDAEKQKIDNQLSLYKILKIHKMQTNLNKTSQGMQIHMLKRICFLLFFFCNITSYYILRLWHSNRRSEISVSSTKTYTVDKTVINRLPAYNLSTGIRQKQINKK